MELAQTISQSQTMQMGGQLLQSLAILGMSSNDLADHVQERAEANPYVAYRPPAAFAMRGGGEDFDAVAQVAADRPSLMAHVVEQIEAAFGLPADRLIALHFAEALEPTGWLAQPVETIAMLAGCPMAKAERVLEVLQGFEPAGLFARNLADCLLLQARDADILTWEVETLIRNLDLLDGQRERLADLCDCEISDIPEILGEIRGLNPKPGLAFDHVAAPVFPPDLIATPGAAGWTVELNRATTPTITVREDFGADDGADREARKLRRKSLAEARALALALERRGDTLLRTGAVLVARQSRFLDRGPALLAPLTLEDVAAELGVHASTISRAVSGRMIQTPTRALPLRAFFSRPVSTAPGGVVVSRDSMMDFVQRVVHDENPQEPLSDDAIVALAARSGMRIARRTVAKYRSALGLASSYERRRRAIGA